MITLVELSIFLTRAVFTAGISIGAFKTGGFLSAFLIGSVLTFNQDVLEKKENGLMFCYHCNHQIDPKAKAGLYKSLDEHQGLIAFTCATCRLDNYFPIAPLQKERAIHGGKIYGELKERLFGNGNGNSTLKPN